MKKVKSILPLLLVLMMMLPVHPIVFAAIEDTGFSDVSADAWYADAVKHCAEYSLMSGTDAEKFSPDTPMSRSMLATVLYRVAGSPEITDISGFPDVPQGTWFSDAVTWAAHNRIVSGYGSGLFGTNDAVTREQIAAILWRYSGSPAVNNTASPFSDSEMISSYAVEAVAWARELEIVGGKPGNLFDPQGSATRAEVATILRNFLRMKQSEPEPQPAPAPTPVPSPEPEPPVSEGMSNITISVGNAVFSAKLYDNDAARAFLAILPITLNMSELNGNEKYHYLPSRLPTDSQQVGRISTGDLMLYGSDCLVLFYKNFSTSYSYTKLGYMEDASGLVAALGSGSAEITFAK